MLNSTLIPHFILKVYADIGLLKYAVSVLLLLWYAVVLLFNLLLVAVICRSRSLHKPMFMFLCGLLANEVCGSTAVFPMLLSQIYQQGHVVSRAVCFLQIFCLYSYTGTELNMLALMSYDRYLAICRPLQYGSSMTPAKMAGLTALAWGHSFLMNVFTIYGLSVKLTLCKTVIYKVYCDNPWVVRLICSEKPANNIFGLVFCCLFIVISLILYSYGRILHVCLSSSKRARHTAFTTCTPHVMAILNYFVGGLFDLMQIQFDMSVLSPHLRVFLSLYWLTVQPLVSPMVYGLKMTKIRLVVWALLSRK